MSIYYEVNEVFKNLRFMKEWTRKQKIPILIIIIIILIIIIIIIIITIIIKPLETSRPSVRFCKTQKNIYINRKVYNNNINNNNNNNDNNSSSNNKIAMKDFKGVTTRTCESYF